MEYLQLDYGKQEKFCLYPSHVTFLGHISRKLGRIVIFAFYIHFSGHWGGHNVFFGWGMATPRNDPEVNSY